MTSPPSPHLLGTVMAGGGRRIMADVIIFSIFFYLFPFIVSIILDPTNNSCFIFPPCLGDTWLKRFFQFCIENEEEQLKTLSKIFFILPKFYHFATYLANSLMLLRLVWCDSGYYYLNEDGWFLSARCWSLPGGGDLKWQQTKTGENTFKAGKHENLAKLNKKPGIAAADISIINGRRNAPLPAPTLTQMFIWTKENYIFHYSCIVSNAGALAVITV